MPIGKIANAHIQEWIKGMTVRGAKKATGLAPATIETRYNLIRQAFKQAVRDRVIAEDPTDGVKLPRQRRKAAAMTVPTVEQVRRALECAPDWFRTYVAVCAFAGLRLGEAAGLQLKDVDFLRRTISVRRQLQGANNHALEEVPPKHQSERAIYIPLRLAEMLSAHVQEFGVRGDDEWLFSVNGRLLNRGSAGHYWRETRKAAGLDEFTLHDLRHFYASALIADGCDVVTVQRALGHSVPSITLNTYSHLWPTAEDKTRTAATGLMTAVLDGGADSLRTAEGSP
ncbi:tyrosine-type recombinase/integrase [Zhihengliuella alba]